MTKNFKKVLCVILVVVMAISSNTIVLAVESENESISFVESVENELATLGTTIDKEYEEMVNEYKHLLNVAESDEEKEKIISLLNTLQELYNSYNNSSLQRGFVYDTEIFIAIQAFNAMGCKLSAELLTHARDNTELDSYYEPINDDAISTTPTFLSIKDNDIVSGTGSFEIDENDDLFYAIHAFNYRKSESGRLVVIEDRYDFAYNETPKNFTETVINAIYAAQEAGELVPFYTYIMVDTDNEEQNQTETVNISSVKDTRYFEDFVVVGDFEYKDYKITFNTTGNKVLQTFGRGDTMIDVFDEDGELIESDDDSGYSYNAMISRTFNAGEEYTVRVSGTAYYPCDFKFAVTPASGLIDAGADIFWGYDDIYAVSGYSAFTLITSTELNATHMLTFTPPSDGTYSFYLESEKDGYMYVIDPRSSNLLVEYEDYDDDNGEGLNPLIEKELDAGIPYLVIYCPYNLANSNAVGDTRVQIAKK